MWKRIKLWWKRMWCPHDECVDIGTFGVTGKGKLWVSSRCVDCGQYFAREHLTGKRYKTNGPGFGFKSVC
jgi:hypothetical protein